MKILRIVYDWPPPWQGLAPHPYELTLSQVKLGDEVELFCGRWPRAGELESPKGVKIHPILREPLPGTIFFTSSILLFFQYLFSRRNTTADVIHAHGHFAIWIYLYRCILKKFFPWAKELKTPLVAHFHNTAAGRTQTFEDQGKPVKAHSRYMTWPLTTLSDKWAVGCAAACIFVSNDTKKEAVDSYKADPDRCFVIESGVNTDIFFPIGDEEKEKSRRELGLDMYDKVVLFHSMIVERKNPHLVIEALAQLPTDYKLLMVGGGDSAYIEKLNEQIKGLGLKERVIITGYTPYPQVPIAYQISDIMVLPSSWEGLPKVVMQGLACGIPCLASGFKLSEDITGLYYIDELNAKLIARRILDITSQKVPVDIQKVVLHYSWEKRAREIIKIYDFAKKNYI